MSRSYDDMARDTLEAMKASAREQFSMIGDIGFFSGIRREAFVISYDREQGTTPPTTIQIMDRAFEINLFGMTVINYKVLQQTDDGYFCIIFRDEHRTTSFGLFADSGLVATAERFDSIDAFFDGILPVIEELSDYTVAFDILDPIVAALRAIAHSRSI